MLVKPLGTFIFRLDYRMNVASSSPIVVDGLCIAQLGGQKEGALVAYDLATGEQKWKTPTDSPAYASPELMSVGGTKLSEYTLWQFSRTASTKAAGPQTNTASGDGIAAARCLGPNRPSRSPPAERV